MHRRILPVLACAILLLSHPAHAGGIRTALGEVRIDNISVGQTFSLEKDAKTPLVIENTSEVEYEIKVEILLPGENELVAGYEALPDTSWIRPEKEALILPALGKASTDIIIDIPYDDRQRGKKYQVYILSRTVTGSIIMALKSKILLSIAE